MTEAEIELVERAYALVREVGVDELLERYDEFFADDFEFRPVLAGSVEGRTYRGRSGFEEYWRSFNDAFEGIEFIGPAFESVDADRILVTTTVRGHSAGAQVPIELEVAHLWEIKDGLIAAGETFTSPRDARERLAR